MFPKNKIFVCIMFRVKSNLCLKQTLLGYLQEKGASYVFQNHDLGYFFTYFWYVTLCW